MSDALLKWCVDQLHYKFGLEASEDIVQYILSIEKAEEIEEYVGDLLQGTDRKKEPFIEELLIRWEKSRKQTTDNNLFLLTESVPSSDSSEITKDAQKKSKRKGRNRQEAVTLNKIEAEPETVKTPIDERRMQESSSTTSVKKKNKFIGLYNKEGQDRLSVLLPGRHTCECLAQKHKLINNCLSCGRIVCEQEGSGPCLFCGSLVCTNDEQEILQRDSNKSQKLRKKLMGDFGEREYLPHHEAAMKAGLEKAVQHKEKLLEYDRNSVRRTQVLDDESDYFATDSNQWLSPNEREKLRKKEEELRELRHASRKDRKITLDFAGRQVIDEGNNLDEYYKKMDETLKAMNQGSMSESPKPSEGQMSRSLRGRELVNPNIRQSAPEWVDVSGRENSRRNERGRSSAEDKEREDRASLRLQDRELQEMSDGGWCLSMHQPWASLLVRGIKRVEGRTWYTSHRGRLWIAAAAKKPTPQEIAEVEATYRHIYRKELRFPDDYPTACLLGCVNVTDCLSQEQFRQQGFGEFLVWFLQLSPAPSSNRPHFTPYIEFLLPDTAGVSLQSLQFPATCDESDSPFVFICTNPQELLVKFPIKGRHKIWKLESQCHRGAKKGLRPSAAE